MHIAIAGCGQLARMLALAGWEMGYKLSFIADPGEDTRCVKGLGKIVTRTDKMSAEQLHLKLGLPEVLTSEKEHVNFDLLAELSEFCLVAPSPEAIFICQHRGREKQLLRELGIDTAPFRLIQGNETLVTAVETLGYPCFVKSCEMGYDGQNQWFLRDRSDTADLLTKIDKLPELVVEGAVNFDRELSLIAVRSISGEIATYPLAENRHREGILLTSEVPASNVAESTIKKAADIAVKLLNHWSYVGVLSIELFDEGGVLRVNEIAPRVHNSGHWSQDADVTSQFSNHLRAITDTSPGSTQPSSFHGMVNLLGRSPDPLLLQASDVSLHWYNKKVRSRRKVGHLNVKTQTRTRLRRRLAELEKAVYPIGVPL